VYDKQIPPDTDDLRRVTKVFEAEQLAGLNSMDDIIDQALRAGQEIDSQVARLSNTKMQKRYRLNFERSPWRVWCRSNDLRIPVLEARVLDTLERHQTNMPIRIWAYEQVGFEGALAWVLLATGKYEDHDLSVRIPITRDENGKVRAGQPEVSDIPGHTWKGNGAVLIIGSRSPNPMQ